MKALKKDLQTLKKSNNTSGWIFAVAGIHQTLDDLLKARKEKLFMLDRRSPVSDRMSEELNSLGEVLVQEQQKVVSRLEQLSMQQSNLVELFSKYENLKRERQELLNRLAAERHDVKEKLAAEVNRFR